MLRFMVYMRGAMGLDGPAAYHLDQPHTSWEWASFNRKLDAPVSLPSIAVDEKVRTDSVQLTPGT